MGYAVYVLCALMSLVCAGLLIRSYLEKRTRLLLWSSLCFAGLALNNVLLFVDRVIVPGTDFSLWRSTSGLASVLVLLFGLIWDTR